MNLIQLLLLQLTAHFIADFIFQSETWSEKKKLKPYTKYHLVHATIVFLISFLMSFDWYFVIPALIIAVSHLLIDILKSIICLKYSHKCNIFFYVDQLLHILIFSVVSWFYINNFNPKPMVVIHFDTKIIAIITAFVFCTKPANVFIKMIFDTSRINIPAEDKIAEKELQNAGKVIGIIERFMTLALVLSSQFAAVGLIIAAKSILRFNAPQKNEYILVGTLLSFGFALLAGILINHI